MTGRGRFYVYGQPRKWCHNAILALTLAGGAVLLFWMLGSLHSLHNWPHATVIQLLPP
jgi:hypothetical protein